MDWAVSIGSRHGDFAGCLHDVAQASQQTRIPKLGNNFRCETFVIYEGSSAFFSPRQPTISQLLNSGEMTMRLSKSFSIKTSGMTTRLSNMDFISSDDVITKRPSHGVKKKLPSKAGPVAGRERDELVVRTSPWTGHLPLPPKGWSQLPRWFNLQTLVYSCPRSPFPIDVQ